MKRLLLIGLSALAINCFAQDLPDREHIIVSGHGYVEEMPDFAEISLTVAKTSKTLKESKDYVDSITQNIFDAVLKHKVDNEDISASKIYASPHYEWGRDEKKYLGERVRRTIKVTLRDLDSYSALVQAIIDAGVTELDGVQLKFEDRDTLEREAMKVAIEDAKKNGESIAKQFGASIDGVFRISESSIDDRRHYAYKAEMALADVRAPGQRAELKIAKQRVDESVYVVFYLE